MKFPERVEVVEVGPRDGLQAQEQIYSVETKVEMIGILADAGFKTIEVTGLVRPDVIPQLADGSEVLEQLDRRPGVTYRALCPNLKGAQRAINVRADELLGLIVASDTYNQKNSRMTVDENLEQLVEMAALARKGGVPMVQAIGGAMFCPYEGDTPPERVLGIIARLWPEGVRSFYLAVSVGLDSPRTVYELCARIKDRWPELVLGLHLHNTNGMAVASALAAADAGAEFFEGSICGIGGGIRMPYGMAPYGNVASEDLVHTFNECGVDTGLDTMTVIDAARRIKDLLELEQTHSYALQGAVKKIVLDQGRTAPRND
ncbi:MAG: hydroxymethylglutaryl-CoA lyase [Actinomycetia bacterium]|nr:hydroxymethylglutaryl-CoA lyase [Actinomycetes bacterium]